MKRVLLVDDDKNLLHSYRRLFLPYRDQLEMHFEEDSRRAEERILGEVWEVIICDQMMPHLRGDQLLETARKDQTEVITVLQTGKESGKNWSENPYIDFHFHKPFPFERLLEILGLS